MDKKELGFTYSYLSMGLFIFQLFCQHYMQEGVSQEVKWGWLVPLFGGCFIFSLDFLLQIFINRPGFCLYHIGLATFTIGIIVQGTLELIHFTSLYMHWFSIAGMALWGISLFISLASYLLKENED